MVMESGSWIRENQVKFHAHLNNMEESLLSTRKEKEEIESLTHQLETGRSRASLELQVCSTPENVRGRTKPGIRPSRGYDHMDVKVTTSCNLALTRKQP